MPTFDEIVKATNSKKASTAPKSSSASKPKNTESFDAIVKRTNPQSNSAGRKVDNEYINSFVSGVNNYFKDSKNAYETMDRANAQETTRARQDALNRLNQQHDTIKNWLYDNRTNISSANYYEIFKMLDSYKNNSSEIMNMLTERSDAFSKMTDDDYNNYLRYKDQEVYDLEAGQKEIDDLEAQLAQLEQNKRYESLQQRINPAKPTEPTRQDIGYNPHTMWQQGTVQTSGISEEEKRRQEIAQKQQYLNQAKRVQESKAYADTVNNEDFDKFDDFVESDDTLYNWINDAQFREDYESLYDAAQQTVYENTLFDVNITSKFTRKNYDQINENEIAIFNYYYAKGGKKAAQKYLDNIQETLNKRKAGEMFGAVEDNVAAELVFGVAAGVNQFGTNVMNNFKFKADYIPQSAYQIASGMVREDLADNGKLPEWLGENSLAQIAYDAVTTTANMAPSILVGIATGGTAGTALMGLSAAGGAYQQALNEGFDKSQARGYSILVGASEAVLEKVLGGISAVGGNAKGLNAVKNIANADNALKAIAKRLGASAWSEFSEEYLQEVLDPLFRNLMMHTGEDVKLVSYEAIYSGILGALTGAFMEAPSAIYSETKTASTGRKIKEAGSVNDLAKIGNTFAPETVAYKLAGKVTNDTGAYTIGQLFNEVNARLTDQNISEIAEVLMKEGMGENEAKRNARNFAYVVEGGTMPDAFANAIEADTLLASAARQVLFEDNTTWNQRSQGYRDVLMKLAEDKVKGKTAPTSKASVPADNTAEAGKENSPSAVQSAEGSDINTATQKAVATDKIKSISKDGVVFAQEDGSEVSSKDVAYADAEDGLIFEAFTEMRELGTDAANEIISIRRKTGGSGQLFANVMRIAYEYGYANLSETGLLAKTYRGNIPNDAVLRIYQIGKEARAAEDSRRSQAKKSVTDGKTGVYRLTETGEVKQLGEGKEALKVLAVNERRSVGVQTAQFLQKIGVGGNYYFIQSYAENGKRLFVDRNGKVQEAHNGMYYSNGDIYIDLNAGTSSGITLFTISHELAHFVQQWNSEKYKVLADFLAKHYAEKGISAYRAIKIKQQELTDSRGTAVSFEEAYHEFVADSLSTMFADGDIYEKLLDLKKTDKSVFDKIRSYINKLAQKAKLYYGGEIANTTEGMFMQMQSKETIDQLQQMFADALIGASANYRNAEAQKNTDQDVGVQYSLSANAKSEVNQALSDKNYSKEIKLTDTTPSILLGQKGVKNLPMLMKASHIRENVLTESEAQKLGLKVNKYINYHGLGESLFLKIIEGLDDVKEAYRGTKNADDPTRRERYFLLVSQYTDQNGDIVNVPVYINEKGVYNKVFVDTNKIATVYGKIEFRKYIQNQIKNGNLVRIKKRSPQTSESTSPINADYSTDASNNSIRNPNEEVKQNSDASSELVSNRTLLANAMESLAKHEVEKKYLSEYKAKIETMNAEEQRLNQIKSQIKELSFATGPRDKEKLKALREEARKLNNRINIYDKQLLRLEASQALRNILEREKAKAYQRGRAKGEAALERSRENRNKTAMRHKIQNVVKELNSLLLSNDKKRHVPDNLKKAVAEALDLVNMDTVGAEERAAKYADLIAKEQAKANPDQDVIDSYISTMEDILLKGEKMGQRLNELHAAYEEIQNSDDPDIANGYDPVIAGAIKELSATIGNTSIKNMSIEQLSDVYDVYRAVLTRVRDANKAMAENIKASIEELAKSTIREVQSVGGFNKYRISALDAVRKFDWDNLKPVYAMERIGSSTLTEVFNNVRAGEDVWARDISEARAYYLEKSKKYGYDKWDFEKKYRFESNSGIPFELTLEQMMSLYAYSKREQAGEHLRLGGFVFDSNIETTKEKDGKRSILKYKVNTADAHQITPEIMADIIGNLTREQAMFVDEMQDYLSTVMGAKGNEVTSKMYGIKLFKEKFYFPLKSAKQFMFEQNEVSGEVRIKNSGFTNKVVTNANNPVILSNFMDVWSGHVNDMSMYHAFTLPLEDFNRVFNYQTPKKDEVDPVSVKGTIQNAYSPAAVQYMKQLITDLNGGARSDPRADFPNKMMGRFKKGAVFASLSVVIQQPSAVARAAALIDLKYFDGYSAGTLPRMGWDFTKQSVSNVIAPTKETQHNKEWEELKKYAPVALIKEMGYFDTNMGKSTQDYITGKEYEGFGQKMKALVTDSKYRDEILSKAPALADEVAWCAIWRAVKREMVHKHPDLRPSSEAMLKFAGERFTEVISKTQVYDSVLSRSANMRSKDGIMKMATAFMAEPTTSANMVADAILKGKRGNKRYARRTVGAVVSSAILNSILVSFVYAARDDDEDETYLEKYLGSLAGGVIDGINPATYIPFIKDAFAIAQGYDVERSDMAVVSDFINACKQLKSDKISTYQKVENFAGSIAQIFGLPVKNIMRDVRGIYNAIMTITGAEKATGAGVKYAIGEAITGKTVSNKEQLYEARMAGDTAHAARVEARYDDMDSADAAVRAAIKDEFMADKIDEATALDRMVRYAGMDGSEAHWTMDAWKYRKAVGSDDGYGKYGRFHDAVRSGNNLSEVIKEYTDNGVKTSTLTGEITDEFKPIYVEASSSERASMKTKLVDAYVACGMDRDDAEGKLESWDFEAEYGFAYSDRKEAYLTGKVSRAVLTDILIDRGYEEDDADAQIDAYEWEAEGFEDITTSAVRNYNTWAEPAGIPKSVFIGFWEFDNSTENDVDPTTGKKIAYSAVKKIMAYINSLNLTDSQKDALAKSAGWADKTIQKYKLW